MAKFDVSKVTALAEFGQNVLELVRESGLARKRRGGRRKRRAKRSVKQAPRAARAPRAKRTKRTLPAEVPTE